MTLETLKTLRIVIPGIIVLIIALGFFVDPFDPAALAASLTFFSGIFYLIIAVTLGAIYHVTDIRWRLLSASLGRIDDNIKHRLIQPFENDPKIAAATTTLLKGRTLLNIFYHFIDKDESLKQRSKEVYFNGLVWSSLVDSIILCSLGTVSYIIAFFYSHQQHHLAVAVVLAFAVLLAIVFIGRVEKTHIEFGNRQIDYIIVHYKSELRQKLIDVS